MNKRQSNKLNAYKNVHAVLQANQTIYSEIPVLMNLVNQFSEQLNKLISLSSDSTIDTTSVTGAKNEAKETMAKVAAELASAALAWANEQNDAQKVGMFNYSYSDLRFSSDNQSTGICSAILENLQENSAELAAYMIDASDIVALENSINRFAELSDTKGVIKSQAVSDTRTISQLYVSIDDLLNNKLDKLMKRMESKQPAFYNAYQNARTIIDL